MSRKTRTCFVSIIGLPNSGKSSLVNSIVNYPISIVSPKAQTTRDQINGIYTNDDLQIVFVDTPGFHKKINKFSDVLNKNVMDALEGIDLILFLHPVNKFINETTKDLFKSIANFKNKIAILTKLDLEVDDQKLNMQAQNLKKLGFDLVMGYSTEYKMTKNDLISKIEEFAYESNFFYDEDLTTNQSTRFFVKEIIRKHLLLNLKEEIPHQCAVVIENFSEANEKFIEIEATIYVARKSHLPIVIGNGGKMLEKIGTGARKEIESLLDSKIVLKNKVKINNNWFANESKIKKLGY